ncbi:E3 ubiquitin-protein ligase TRIM45-like [Saccostrea echinata]|uniref:E3 ubiquitin-protein ligase TRIM45-like n=1 Tax=Saccostrea echinata TaxID=191078 RepID=UPI002A825342|nr:E3 ubiquitin-protein ligase TRIM45-like [Saccostrea echinata]
MDQVPDSARHLIECDTESCRNYSEFYCNTCHQRICDHCKEAHLKENTGHEIVRYHERKRKLPSEKCRIHPIKDIDVFCKFCQDPVCSTCFAQEHSDHANSDLETIYNDILQECQKEMTDIWKTVIPKAKENAESIGGKRERMSRKKLPSLEYP